MRRGGAVLLALTLCILVIDCRKAGAEGKLDGLVVAAEKNSSRDSSKPTDTSASANGQDDKGHNPVEESQVEIKKAPKGDKVPYAGDAKSVAESTKQEGKGDAGKGSSENLPDADSHVEECDESSRCMDGKRNLVACLRVPGDDFPTLSLLILNKGDAALEIKVHAPKYVNVEASSIPLPAKRNKKVTVSVKEGVKDIPIVLSSGDWRCNLSFWKMIPDSVKSSADYVGPNHLYVSSKVYIALAGVILAVFIGLSYLWKRSRQARIQGQGYQKLDASLPVSSGGVKETDATEAWDDSWGDNWDDEEAPVTPSNPAFNLSSKGLAVRRSTKEGWMD